MTHLNDPCVHCQTPHDEVKSGPCPENTGVTGLLREREHFTNLLKDHLADAKKVEDGFRAKIAALNTKINLFRADVDHEKVAMGLSVLEIGGSYARGGAERDSVINDAVRWFSGLPTGSYYQNLRRAYYGTKDYDRWSGQRCDCEYYMGPRHGSIVFSIGLNRDIRQQQRELTPEENEAAIYVLMNLEKIQAAKAAA